MKKIYCENCNAFLCQVGEEAIYIRKGVSLTPHDEKGIYINCEQCGTISPEIKLLPKLSGEARVTGSVHFGMGNNLQPKETENIDAIYGTAKQIVELLQPLGHHEQAAALALADELGAYVLATRYENETNAVQALLPVFPNHQPASEAS